MENNFAQSILDALVEQIAVINATGEIIQVNRSWENFSYDNEGEATNGKPIGVNYLEVCRNSYEKNKDKYAKYTLDGLEKLYKGKIKTFVLEYPCHSPNMKRWFLLRASKIPSTNHIVLSHSNITDRVIAEKKIETLNQELEAQVLEKTKRIKDINTSLQKKMEEILKKDMALVEKEKEVYQALLKEKELNDLRAKLVSTVSHEIRTPLTNISLSAEMLLKYYQTFDESKRIKYLETIPIACKRIAQTLDQFFLINKIDSNKKTLSLTFVNFKTLWQEILSDVCQFDLEACKRIKEIGLEKTDFDIELDPFFVKHIIRNLLSNSLKFSEDNTDITFEVEIDVTQISFTIKDIGIGIPEKDKSNIFETFYRGENVGNRIGVGLGLYIVKRSVEMCKGKIEFSSIENEGTIFKVTLPTTKKET